MKIWKHTLDKLLDNQKVYFLTVIENFGSSPGRKGFKMLVAEDGFIFGSVGGGVMEFTLVEEVKKLFKGENCPTFIKKQIHKGKIKDGSGMICSGEQTVAFHCLNQEHITVVEDILKCLDNNERGTLCLSANSFYFSHKVLENQFNYEIKSTEDWFYEEQIGYKETIYIVGGGHVGLAVSELFNTLGFYVIVLDDRSNLNTFEENTFAHKKELISFNQVGNYIQEGANSYVAIMTNKYTDDKLVLSKIIRNNYKFIGVLGSKAKLKTLWEVMRNEGFSEKELNTVHAPIGLSIKSQTPEEIAVSIAAQVIQIKNKTK